MLKPLFRHTLRDWRRREIRLLFLALVIAVLSVTSIGFFTDRVERAMRLQGTALLGADLLISSSRPISTNVKQLSQTLNTEQVIEFRSVLLSGDDTLLVEVKAVGSNYPLRGSVQTSTTLSDLGSTNHSTPKIGEAWAAPEVFYQLGLKPGSRIQLGESELVLRRVIRFEMDAGGSTFRLAPRLMIHLNTLPETQLITTASRAQYKWLISGSEEKINRLTPKLKSTLGQSETLQTVDEGRPEISDALQRATRFMKLASVLTIIISGAAIALATLSFAQKERPRIAILKTLGASRRQLWRQYAARFSLLIIASSLVGSGLGFMAQSLFADLLSGWMNTPLPPARLWPITAGLVTALLTLLGFALPNIIQVIQTPPMRVMREEVKSTTANRLLSITSVGLIMAGFLFWQAGELKLASVVFFAVTGGLSIMLFFAWLLTRLFTQIQAHHGQAWLLGLANIGRHGGRAALLISTTGIGIFALSLLGGVREDLISAWQGRIPADAPNHFLVNIQPTDLNKIKDFLSQRKIDQFSLYPMVRGRLRAINEHPVSSENFTARQAKETLERELNLSSTESIPKGNQIVSGEWLNAKPRNSFLPGVSVENKLATTLGLKLNDTVQFDISGQTLTAVITSLRSVQWDTLQPNFYFIVAPGGLDKFSATNITSVKITDNDTQFTTELVRAFPHITVLDVRAILNQIQSVIAQVSRAVEVVFTFSLLAGIVVLLAAIQTQSNERRQEIAVLKTLGASQRQIRHSVAAEFIALGALAGLLGTGLALLTGWGLAEWVFNFDYHASLLPILWGFLAGVIGLGGVGFSVIQSLVKTSPTHLLQNH